MHASIDGPAVLVNSHGTAFALPGLLGRSLWFVTTSDAKDVHDDVLRATAVSRHAGRAFFLASLAALVANVLHMVVCLLGEASGWMVLSHALTWLMVPVMLAGVAIWTLARVDSLIEERPDVLGVNRLDRSRVVDALPRRLDQWALHPEQITEEVLARLTAAASVGRYDHELSLIAQESLSPPTR